MVYPLELVNQQRTCKLHSIADIQHQRVKIPGGAPASRYIVAFENISHVVLREILLARISGA